VLTWADHLRLDDKYYAQVSRVDIDSNIVINLWRNRNYRRKDVWPRLPESWGSCVPGGARADFGAQQQGVLAFDKDGRRSGCHADFTRGEFDNFVFEAADHHHANYMRSSILAQSCAFGAAEPA